MYFNTLIIMNEDTPGYGQKSRSPSGYCKLTTPNRLICYVQGLKRLPKGQTYKLYLMSKQEEQSIAIGRFEVEESGNRELRWTIDPSDINNSKVNAQQVDGALIVVEGQNLQSIKVPLVGFAQEPYSWVGLMKRKFDNKTEVIQEENLTRQDLTKQPKVTQPATGQTQPVTDQSSPQLIQPTTGQSSQPTQPAMVQSPQQSPMGESLAKNISLLKEELSNLYSETLADNISLLKDELLQAYSESLAQSIAPFQEEIEMLKQQVEELKAQLANQIPSQTINEPEAETMPQDNDMARYSLKQKMEDMFEKSIPMNPFELNEPHVKWVRITKPELMSLPQLPYEWKIQPFITQSYYKYKHFILGRDSEAMQYYLGIPDIFHPSKRNILEIDKIESFKCCRNTSPRVGEHGYWIVRL